MRHPLSFIFGMLALFLLGACDSNTPTSEGPHYASTSAAHDRAVYHLAVHPLFNPQKLFEAYEPLVVYLGKNIPEARFELEASRDYAAFEAKLRSRTPELLLPNPWQTLEAMKAGYRVIAMAGNTDDFKGILLVRWNSSIRNVSDLKGKIMSCPAATALAACILPQYFLHQHGLDIMHDIETRYVGSMESSITHVLLRQSDIGASWPLPWRAYQKDHPQEAAELRVIWETPPLLNNSVMVRDDVPDPIRQRVRELLLTLDQSAEGRSILAGMETARFHDANDAAYEPVRQFIRRFEQEVRPVGIHP